LVIEGLLETTPADEIIAAVRSTEKAQALRNLGVQVRDADYDRPETLAKAFQGAKKLLLISAVVPGERLREVTSASSRDRCGETGRGGVVAYTSLLRADSSDLVLAAEHKATENYLKDSGVSFILLRNGWYLENPTAALPAALQNGAIIGSAGEGRFASVSRADYAGAAVVVLTQPGHENSSSHDLSRLLGRPTTALSEAVAAAVGASGDWSRRSDLNR
jgi:NAD(P)H dehydrogenase (quinone)